MLEQPEYLKKIPGIQATFTAAMKNGWRLSAKTLSTLEIEPFVS